MMIKKDEEKVFMGQKKLMIAF